MKLRFKMRLKWGPQTRALSRLLTLGLCGNLYQAPARITLDGRLFYAHPACYYGDADVDFAGIWLREKRDALTQGLRFENKLELSVQSQARMFWYQLYYALVEFNLMTQQDSRLVGALVEAIQSVTD